jgi:uncharacterized membrane protein YhaH (DUF805 family)
LGPLQSITTCLRKSFDFSGRASRAEFWWFAPVAICVVVYGFADEWFFRLLDNMFGRTDVLVSILIGLIVALLPVYAALSRRVRDTGLPGRLALALPIWALVGPFLSIAIDKSPTLSIPGKSRGMPEFQYVSFVYLGLFGIFLLVALLPTRNRNNVLPSHEVSP